MAAGPQAPAAHRGARTAPTRPQGQGILLLRRLVLGGGEFVFAASLLSLLAPFTASLSFIFVCICIIQCHAADAQMPRDRCTLLHYVLAGAFFSKGTVYEGSSAPGALEGLVVATV